MREDTVQLVQTVVADDEPALASARMLDRDLRAQLLAELLLQSRDIGIGACSRLAGRRGGFLQAAHEGFRLADRQSLAGYQRRDLDLLSPLGQREQRAGMAHLDLAPLDALGNLRRELEQSQQ